MKIRFLNHNGDIVRSIGPRFDAPVMNPASLPKKGEIVVLATDHGDQYAEYEVTDVRHVYGRGFDMNPFTKHETQIWLREMVPADA